MKPRLRAAKTFHRQRTALEEASMTTMALRSPGALRLAILVAFVYMAMCIFSPGLDADTVGKVAADIIETQPAIYKLNFKFLIQFNGIALMFVLIPKVAALRSNSWSLMGGQVLVAALSFLMFGATSDPYVFIPELRTASVGSSLLAGLISSLCVACYCVYTVSQSRRSLPQIFPNPCAICTPWSLPISFHPTWYTSLLFTVLCVSTTCFPMRVMQLLFGDGVLAAGDYTFLSYKLQLSFVVPLVFLWLSGLQLLVVILAHMGMIMGDQSDVAYEQSWLLFAAYVGFALFETMRIQAVVLMGGSASLDQFLLILSVVGVCVSARTIRHGKEDDDDDDEDAEGDYKPPIHN